VNKENRIQEIIESGQFTALFTDSWQFILIGRKLETEEEIEKYLEAGKTHYRDCLLEDWAWLFIEKAGGNVL